MCVQIFLWACCSYMRADLSWACCSYTRADLIRGLLQLCVCRSHHGPVPVIRVQISSRACCSYTRADLITGLLQLRKPVVVDLLRKPVEKPVVRPGVCVRIVDLLRKLASKPLRTPVVKPVVRLLIGYPVWNLTLLRVLVLIGYPVTRVGPYWSSLLRPVEDDGRSIKTHTHPASHY